MSRTLKKTFAMGCAFLFLGAAALFCSCSGEEDDSSSSGTDSSVSVEVTSWSILEDTDRETTVYRYVTDAEGPKTVIVGGTHGDELAGWKTALELVDEIPSMDGLCGEILLIPQANIVACENETRCYNTESNLTSHNLNRAFPLERYDDVIDEVIEIADAIVETVEDFVGDFEVEEAGDLCIVDLHESISSERLGSTLIYSNQIFFMEDMLEIYNDSYREEDEDKFTHEDATQAGSFSYYFTDRYSDAVVFTVETDRGTVDGVDTIDLDVRMRQQKNMLNALFDLTWGRVDVE